MANRTRRHKQHGIEINQVEFSGKWYTPVDDRIVIANHAAVETVRTQAGYSVIEHAMVPVGERWAYTCRIEYPHGSGHFYPGSDFIDMTAKDGLAKAETSAIGRALGLAGIAIESGIASAEEMSRVEHQEAPAQPQQQRDGIALDNGVAATKDDITALRQAVMGAHLDGAAFVVKVPELCEGRVLDRLTKGDVRDLLRRIADHPEQFPKKTKTPA